MTILVIHLVEVHSEDHGRIRRLVALGRRRDDYLAGARGEMLLGGGAGAEVTG